MTDSIEQQDGAPEREQTGADAQEGVGQASRLAEDAAADPASETAGETPEEGPHEGVGQASRLSEGTADEADDAKSPAKAPPVGDDAHLKAVLEAILFATERPVTMRQLTEAVEELDTRRARKLIEELRREYDDQGRAFQVEEIAEGFQMLTRAEYRDWIMALRRRKKDTRLSEAAVETLAIVAYKQPVSRARVEDIRGVQSDHLLRALMERRLIKIVGREETPGRPLLYGTTKDFLDVFGLSSLKDLPTQRDLPQVP